MTTVADLMETLVVRRARSQPPSVLADILDRLIWCMDDNGEDVEQVRAQWLEGDDPDKVAIALAMSEVFPAQDRPELVRLLTRIGQRWPEFQTACDGILTRWDNQFEQPPPSSTNGTHHGGRAAVNAGVP